MDAAQIFGKTFDLNLGKLIISPSYFQAGAIVFLLFLLVLTMAQFRRHLMGWSLKGGLFGLFLGFMSALILEGFLLIGGKTAFTEIIGWKNAPKPLLGVLEAGRNKLSEVLGESITIPDSTAQVTASKEKVLQDFQTLSPQDASAVRKMLCTP